MEEIRKLATEYYENTVKLRFFGFKGAVCIVASIPFFYLSIYLNFYSNLANFAILPAIIAAGLWVVARTSYDKNLIIHLSYYTHSESEQVSEHKALYLHYLTSHVGSSLFSVLKSFNEILESHSKNKSFVINYGWSHFFTFLYDPESKNRILSLFIYLVSLIALLTVVELDSSQIIFRWYEETTIESLLQFFFWAAIAIILGYILIVLPFMFVFTFLVVPLFLMLSSAFMLSKHFMSDLNKYAFLEVKGGN